MQGKKNKKGSLSHEIANVTKIRQECYLQYMHNRKDENSKTKMTNDEEACIHDSTWWTIEGVYEMFGV
jgi:hypothetical protein